MISECFNSILIGNAAFKKLGSLKTEFVDQFC